MPSTYERRVVLSYLQNAVSRLHHRTEQATNLVKWLVKHGDQLNLQYPFGPSEETEEAIRHRLEKDNRVSPLEWQRLEESLRNESARVRQVRPDREARRLRSLARVLRLSRTDTAILELLLRLRTGSMVFSMMRTLLDGVECRGRGFTLGDTTVPCVLGLSFNAFDARFTPNAPLVTSGLVTIDYDGDVSVIDRLTRLEWFPSEAGSDVKRLLLDRADSGDLSWSDFDHAAKDRDHVERILTGALRTGETGVNVLVYGPPGTGKTEFCKTLANRLAAPLYVVGESDNVGDEPTRNERLQELRLAQRVLAPEHRSILLFDEMEDLLSDDGAALVALLGSRVSRGIRAGGSKVFMNRLLEQTPVPILWTSNSARQTSPVLLRRMMFAMELRQPPPRVRARIWKRQLAHHGIESSEEDVHALAREFDVTPGVAAGVTAAARLGGGTLAHVRHGVRGLERVLSGDKPPVQRPPDKYDPALIRADVDPVQLANRLVASDTRHFSLSLQGPPGTGKSAFVRYLADRLGLEVVQKRASDLMSMWVGGTEANIAEAFAEARDAEAFLVFDEADSLLADRHLAERSWEVSQVNEMLTWMENHPLPIACTTNFGDRLDPATLRRFTFKVALDFLSPEQARAAFRIYFDMDAPNAIGGLANLTPGDFAVVRRMAEILGCLGEPRTLAGMLGAECEAKPGCAQPVGFRM